MIAVNHDKCCDGISYDSSTHICCAGTTLHMLDGSGNQECCGTSLIDTTQEYCCDPDKNLVGDGIDISSCSCVTSGQFTCEYKPDGDYSITPSKTAVCRSHINKDNTIHYHNECIDNDKLGMAGPNDTYDDDKLIVNCGCCESIDEENNPNISAIDGISEIREIDQEWCLYEDCYATGNAPVCSKAGDKNAKVTLCYFDESYLHLFLCCRLFLIRRFLWRLFSASIFSNIILVSFHENDSL